MSMSQQKMILCMVAILAAVTPLGGCATRTYTITMDMLPEHSAQVEVLGQSPFVVITNNGPGQLQLVMRSNEQGTVTEGSIGAAVTGRTLRGGGTIEIVCGLEPTRVRIKASSADGVAVNESPTPVHTLMDATDTDAAIEPPPPGEADADADPDESADPPTDELLDVLNDPAGSGGADQPGGDPQPPDDGSEPDTRNKEMIGA